MLFFLFFLIFSNNLFFCISESNDFKDENYLDFLYNIVNYTDQFQPTIINDKLKRLSRTKLSNKKNQLLRRIESDNDFYNLNYLPPSQSFVNPTYPTYYPNSYPTTYQKYQNKNYYNKYNSGYLNSHRQISPSSSNLNYEISPYYSQQNDLTQRQLYKYTPHGIAERTDFGSLLPVITVIGIGAFMIPLLTTFFTALLSSNPTCCQNKRRSKNYQNYTQDFFEQSKNVYNDVEKAFKSKW